MELDDDDKNGKKSFKKTMKELEEEGVLTIDADGVVTLNKNKKRKKEKKEKKEKKRKTEEDTAKEEKDDNTKEEEEEETSPKKIERAHV